MFKVLNIVEDCDLQFNSFCQNKVKLLNGCLQRDLCHSRWPAINQSESCLSVLQTYIHIDLI